LVNPIGQPFVGPVIWGMLHASAAIYSLSQDETSRWGVNELKNGWLKPAWSRLGRLWESVTELPGIQPA